MNTATVRSKFLDFFKGHEHYVRGSFSLIPQDDPTLLFNSAGMAPFKPYFLGLKTDLKRAATCQKCFRTTDIENVGYTARHHTFFEMLGNFSFGDYFKKDAIAWAWEFITKVVNLDVKKLYVSVHHSDDEAREIWHKSIGVASDHIITLGDKDNFWTIGVGPSGPCSEIYIDQGPGIGCGSPDCAPGCDCPRYLEFWNLVFTQYNRAEDGALTPLKKKNIDTGMGLERLAAILQGKLDNFENDVFSGIVGAVEKHTGKHFAEGGKTRTALKVVADHVRALSFAIADGALPGNEGRGYVLRKILRRASRFGYKYLGQEEPFLHTIVPTVARIMDSYPEVGQNLELVTRVVKSEEERFLQTLKTGSEMLNGYIADLKKAGAKQLDGGRAFQLHDTYGFPLDLTREICKEEQLLVDETGFNTELEKQRERGRANVVSAFVNFSAINPAEYGKTVFTGYTTMTDTSTVLNVVEAGDELLVITDRTPFYAASGGQIGDHGVIRGKGAEFAVHTTDKVEDVFIHRGRWAGTARFGKGDQVELHVDTTSRRATMRNHTATHLLHKALQELLGGHVKQAGSAVDPDRLRFDFTHFQSIDPTTLGAIEQRVNDRVLESLPVNTVETSYDEAVKLGAMALFGEKYGDVVRLVRVGNYSKELCGGTHISNSSEIGMFAILGESSIASGVRRIEAVTGAGAYARLQSMRQETRDLAKVLDCDPKSLLQKAEKLVSRVGELEKEIEAARKSDAKGQIEKARQSVRVIGGAQAIIARVDGMGAPELQQMTDELVGSRENVLCLLAGGGEKATFVLKISKDLVGKGLNAGKLIKEIAKIAGGSGGGRPDMATAGGKEPAKIDEALKAAESLIGSSLGASA